LFIAVAVAAETLVAVGIPEGGAVTETTVDRAGEVTMDGVWMLAVIVVEAPFPDPARTVTRPDALTVATLGFDDANFTALASKVSVTWLLYIAVTVSCSVAPTESVTAEGDSAMYSI
jgi:hypothetical protein